MAHWPEIHKYCGCIDLKFGVYIQTFLTLVITTGGVVEQGIDYAALWRTKNEVFNLFTNQTFLEEHSNEEIRLAIDIYYGILIFILIWLVLKCIFLATVLMTLYAYWKRNASLLLLHFYISTLHLILEVIVCLMIAVSSNFFRKLFVFSYVCFQGYHILLVSTVYKTYVGKSKLVTDETEVQRDYNIQLPTVGFISPLHRNIRSCAATTTLQSCDPSIETPNDHAFIPPHCSSCSCPPLSAVDSHSTPAPNASITSTILPTFSDRLLPEAKELNFKDAPLIFNQELLTNGISPIFEGDQFGECSTARANCSTKLNIVNNGAEIQTSSEINTRNMALTRSRPQTLLLKSGGEKSDPDAPVIYDSNQLNVGISPIFENRRDEFDRTYV